MKKEYMAGRPKDVSDSEILKEIALARGPVVTAPELADRVGMTGSAVNKRLDDLVTRGFVNKKQVGARAVVYWLTDDGRELAADA